MDRNIPRVLTGYEKGKGFLFIITRITWNCIIIMSEFELRRGCYSCRVEKTGALTKPSWANQTHDLRSPIRTPHDSP